MLCQPNEVTSAPHTTGANAGPNVITQPPMDMNVPRRFFGMTARIVFIMAGMKMPVPTACTRRATISMAKLFAKSPIAEPPRLRIAAARNNVRSLTRRYRKAMHETTTVETIIYPVTNHCAVTESTLYSAMMDMSAMFTRFSLNPATNAAT